MSDEAFSWDPALFRAALAHDQLSVEDFAVWFNSRSGTHAKPRTVRAWKAGQMVPRGQHVRDAIMTWVLRDSAFARALLQARGSQRHAARRTLLQAAARLTREADALATS